MRAARQRGHGVAGAVHRPRGGGAVRPAFWCALARQARVSPHCASRWCLCIAGARVLDPEDVANAVLFALTQPEHVGVNEVLVEPREEPV